MSLIIFSIYYLFGIILLPVQILLLFFRVYNKKEDYNSIFQKLGYSSKIRPKDCALIWIHAASVGEANIALTLIEHLSKKNRCFLVTSVTLTSSKILNEKLPEGAYHQFCPLDNPIFIWFFLNHWKPNLGIFIESEIWPCLIRMAKARCRLLLLNARMSDTSFRRWRFLKVAHYILECFKVIVTQSRLDEQKYKSLGAHNVLNLGNIKFANSKLSIRPLGKLASGSGMQGAYGTEETESLLNVPEDSSTGATKQCTAKVEFPKRSMQQDYLTTLSKALIGKKVFVAASTHKEDEAVILPAFKKLKINHPAIYLIIIPRHIDRKKEIGLLCSELGFKYSISSESNIDPNQDIFIVDQFGTLGTCFSIADFTFIGGSFKHGCHNILEPGHFKNFILFGPDVSNISEIAQKMLEQNAAIQIFDELSLIQIIQKVIIDQNFKIPYKENAFNFVSMQQQILPSYLNIIEGMLNNNRPLGKLASGSEMQGASETEIPERT